VHRQHPRVRPESLLVEANVPEVPLHGGCRPVVEAVGRQLADQPKGLIRHAFAEPAARVAVFDDPLDLRPLIAERTRHRIHDVTIIAEHPQCPCRCEPVEQHGKLLRLHQALDHDQRCRRRRDEMIDHRALAQLIPTKGARVALVVDVRLVAPLENVHHHVRARALHAGNQEDGRSRSGRPRG
jgi:hypothetical protein